MESQELVNSGGGVANAMPNQAKGVSVYGSPYSEMGM